MTTVTLTDANFYNGKTLVDGDRDNGIWFERNMCNNPTYSIVRNGVFMQWYRSLEEALHYVRAS